MERHEYRTMFELEDRHWWFQGRLLMTEQLLRRHILPEFVGRKPHLLDVGCGTGMFLRRREDDTQAYGIDFSTDALAFCRRRSRDRRLARADAARLPFADASFDVVTAFDLIEHVADDKSLIGELWRVLRPGGFFLATVPAHPFLWTGHDVSLHHRRRYRWPQLDALFARDRWRTVRMSGGFFLIYPLAAVVRIAHRLTTGGAPHSDTHPTAPWLNRMLIGLHRLEAAWLARHTLPTGLSLFTIRQKI